VAVVVNRTGGAADHEWAEWNMPLATATSRRNQADPVGTGQDEPRQSAVEQGRPA
jgi:hypothetical protein